jgi:hypothetical protein
LEDCSNDVKQRFSEEAGKLKKNGYEVLVESKDDAENVQILLKSEKDKIHELLIVTTGGDDPAMVRITGNINQSDIQTLINKH